MIIGVFTPVINWCGGAEWVSLNIINALSEQGHQVIVLVNKPVDKKKIEHIFNKKISQVQEIVFPLELFPSSDYHNIYSDQLRLFLLKTKSELVIDTYSNAMLPIADVSYVHHPLQRLIEMQSNRSNKLYFLPYNNCLRANRGAVARNLIFANSKFTAEVIRRQLGVNPHVLYPPIQKAIIDTVKSHKRRSNNVITVSRLCHGKNLEIIPYIARSTPKEISFTIVGLFDSQKMYTILSNLIKNFSVEDRVKIVVNLGREELRKKLLDSKVYLHPTINEHFGVSIAEAMSSGCIPIVHNSGGPKEFVSEHYRYDNMNEAADKVVKAIAEWTPEKAALISTYAEKFSEANFAKRFIEIFGQYCSAKNRF